MSGTGAAIPGQPATNLTMAILGAVPLGESSHLPNRGMHNGTNATESRTCPNNVAVAAAGTVYVTNYHTVTQQRPGETTVVVAGGAYTEVTATVPPEDTQVVIGGNYCSTLTADGDDLPTTAQGDCGTILVVSGGSRGGLDAMVFWGLIWCVDLLRQLL